MTVTLASMMFHIHSGTASPTAVLAAALVVDEDVEALHVGSSSEKNEYEYRTQLTMQVLEATRC